MTERLDVVIPDLVAGRKRNGRGIYNKDAKRRLVEACLQPGVSVARMALIHSLNANLLRKWITEHQAARKPSAGAALIPVVAIKPPVTSCAVRSVIPESVIEIAVGDCTIRVRGAVDAPQLSAVMDCLLARRL